MNDNVEIIDTGRGVRIVNDGYIYTKDRNRNAKNLTGNAKKRGTCTGRMVTNFLNGDHVRNIDYLRGMAFNLRV